MTNSRLLRDKIDEKGLKLKFVAKELGLSDSGLIRKIDNKLEFKQSEIAALCKLLDISDKAIYKIFFAA